MEFESPDVEKDFPGLYASESGKRSQESDFSDDAHDKPSKKDLLIGKRKEKKESKKDQGYAALEGESSPEEDLDLKSPSKSKKSKSFKFPTIKEKREKSREKDVREKEREKEKEREAEKEKKKEKGKLKLKERKKSKHDDEPDIGDALPIFGVPLSVAVERSHCHDGVALPLVLRNCIDHVQDCGLLVEGVYKLSGIKSKVQQLKRSYNQREVVRLTDFDLPTVTSLLKTFFRDLPEPLVTSELLPRFEEAASIKELATREQELAALVSILPPANQLALSWLVLHLEAVAANEKQNKMGANALAVTLGPIFQFSQRLFVALLTHSRALFPNVRITRYVPPLSAGSSVLPDTTSDITLELLKQESLLSQIHSEMNLGYCSTQRTEQLWEVQRLVTQLKRKLKSLERAQEGSHLPSEDTPSTSQLPQSTESLAHSTTITVASSDGTTNSGGSNGSEAEETLVQDDADLATEEARNSESSCGSATLPIDPVKVTYEMSASQDFLTATDESVAQLTSIELQKLQSNLLERIRLEKAAVEKLRAALANLCRSRQINSNAGNGDNSSVEMENELRKQNLMLQQSKQMLLQKIIEERKACLQLRVKCNIFPSDTKSDGSDNKLTLKINSVGDTPT